MEERGRKGGISTSPHDDDAERRDALSSPLNAPTSGYRHRLLHRQLLKDPERLGEK